MFVGSFDELAVDEGRAGTDEGDEMRGVHYAPAVLSRVIGWRCYWRVGTACCRPRVLVDRAWALPMGGAGCLLSQHRSQHIGELFGMAQEAAVAAGKLDR
jgi:hypothetical protein